MARSTPTLRKLHRYRVALQTIRDGLAVPTDAEIRLVSEAAAAANRVLKDSDGPWSRALIAECVLILVLEACIRDDLGVEDEFSESCD